MKTLKRTFFAIFAISFCSCILTSCDPDDIDAFADGYRDGFYGTYGSRAEVSNTTDDAPIIEYDLEK